MAAKQAMKENLQYTSKYGHLRISQDICHVRMTDIEGFLTIYGHSDNLLNNKVCYVLSYVVMRCLQHVSLNDATQKNLSLSASINIKRIA